MTEKGFSEVENGKATLCYNLKVLRDFLKVLDQLRGMQDYD